MKIEQFFKLTINDETLELTSKELRNIANLKTKPTFIITIGDHEFPLSELEYKSLKSSAASLIPRMVVNLERTRKRSISDSALRKIYGTITEEWQSAEDIKNASERSQSLVYPTLKYLHEDGRIIKRRDPRNRRKNQFKLKTHNYKPEHSEIEKIAVIEIPLDLSVLERGRLAKRNAQREI